MLAVRSTCKWEGSKFRLNNFKGKIFETAKRVPFLMRWIGNDLLPIHGKLLSGQWSPTSFTVHSNVCSFKGAKTCQGIQKIVIAITLIETWILLKFGVWARTGTWKQIIGRIS